MAYRTFLDDNGKYWQVWESHPHIFERRKGDRRVSAVPFAGADRRGAQDRRQNARSRGALVDPPLATGWLTFESFTEKRRLAPVPAHWDEVPLRDLMEMWERANPVSRISDESSAA